jgi:hypothetical protein
MAGEWSGEILAPEENLNGYRVVYEVETWLRRICLAAKPKRRGRQPREAADARVLRRFAPRPAQAFGRGPPHTALRTSRRGRTATTCWPTASSSSWPAMPQPAPWASDTVACWTLAHADERAGAQRWSTGGTARGGTTLGREGARRVGARRVGADRCPKPPPATRRAARFDDGGLHSGGARSFLAGQRPRIPGQGVQREVQDQGEDTDQGEDDPLPPGHRWDGFVMTVAAHPGVAPPTPPRPPGHRRSPSA